MPSPRERHRNNIRMGVLVSVALIFALGVVVFLTSAIDRYLVRKDRYTVEFTLRAGVMNIEKGSAVRIGGVKLGEVVEVNPRFREDPFEKIDVVFTVDRRVRLYRDAQVFVSAPLIAAEAWLDIPSVGTLDAGEPPAKRLLGAERAGMLTRMLGSDNAARTDEIFAKTEEIIENVRQFSQVFTRAPEDYEIIMGDIRQITGDARYLIARLSHEDWPQWKQSIDKVAAWAANATDSLDRFIEQGNALLEDARDVVGENRENIERIVANFRATSDELHEFIAWVNDDGRARLVHVLETGGTALEHASDVLGRLNRQHFDRWATDMGFMMASANHSAQQLQLTMTEVRRAPWKLLHIPSQEEVEHEYLYEAIRNFALAAADLKAASVAAQRILDIHSEFLAQDEEALERLKNNLFNQLDRYGQAQQRLMDVLMQE